MSAFIQNRIARIVEGAIADAMNGDWEAARDKAADAILSTLPASQGVPDWPERDNDLAWLARQKDFGHCGESTSDAIYRGRINRRVDRLIEHLSAVPPAPQGEQDLSPAQDQGPSAAQWRPIGTAPKDGTRLLLHCDDTRDGHFQVIGAFFPRGPADSSAWRCCYDGDELNPIRPTHWQPLPPPPEPEPPARSEETGDK